MPISTIVSKRVTLYAHSPKYLKSLCIIVIVNRVRCVVVMKKIMLTQFYTTTINPQTSFITLKLNYQLLHT